VAIEVSVFLVDDSEKIYNVNFYVPYFTVKIYVNGMLQTPAGRFAGLVAGHRKVIRTIFSLRQGFSVLGVIAILLIYGAMCRFH